MLDSSGTNENECVRSSRLIVQHRAYVTCSTTNRYGLDVVRCLQHVQGRTTWRVVATYGSYVKVAGQLCGSAAVVSCAETLRSQHAEHVDVTPQHPMASPGAMLAGRMALAMPTCV